MAKILPLIPYLALFFVGCGVPPIANENYQGASPATLQMRSGRDINLVGNTVVANGAEIGSMKVDHYCSFNAEPLPSIITTFGSDSAAKEAVKRIMSYTGLPPRFEILAANVPNAAAVFRNNKRYILYNQRFMRKAHDMTRNNWSEISILAHEIGHHLSDHTFASLGSRPKLELEADRFSGFVLQRMGASLDDVVAVMKRMASEQGSRTHPPRSTRVVAVTKGWVDADRDQIRPNPKPLIKSEPKPTATKLVPPLHKHGRWEHSHPLPATTGLEHQHGTQPPILKQWIGHFRMTCYRPYRFSKDCSTNWLRFSTPTHKIVIDDIIPLRIAGSESGRVVWVSGDISDARIAYPLIKKFLRAENVTINKAIFITTPIFSIPTSLIPISLKDYTGFVLELESDGYKKLVEYYSDSDWAGRFGGP